MLVSMRDDISVNDTLPGKVQSYMAAGKPVLGSIAGEQPMDRAGWMRFCAPPDDPAAPLRRWCGVSCPVRTARPWGSAGGRITTPISPKATIWTGWKRYHFACGREIGCGFFSLTPTAGSKAQAALRWISPGWWKPTGANAELPWRARYCARSTALCLPRGCALGAKLHGAMRKLLDAEGYGSVRLARGDLSGYGAV